MQVGRYREGRGGKYAISSGANGLTYADLVKRGCSEALVIAGDFFRPSRVMAVNAGAREVRGDNIITF